MTPAEDHEGRERLTLFLYLLMRDVTPTGDVANIVKNFIEPGVRDGLEPIYTAKGLEIYARELATRILNPSLPSEVVGEDGQPLVPTSELRAQILREARELTKLPVEWTSARTTRGDVPNREWTLEVFDVPENAMRGGVLTNSVRVTLRPLFERIYSEHNIGLSLITHNVTNTTQFYAWVREAE